MLLSFLGVLILRNALQSTNIPENVLNDCVLYSCLRREYLLSGSGRDDCAPEKQRRVLELLLFYARCRFRMRIQIDAFEQRRRERHEHVGAARAVREVREHEVHAIEHREYAYARYGEELNFRVRFSRFRIKD